MARGPMASYDDLVDIFGRIENFIGRIRIYTEITLTPAMTEMVVKIMVELLSVLALITKQLNQGRFSMFFLAHNHSPLTSVTEKFAKRLMGESVVESMLLSLDILTDESRTTVAQTLQGDQRQEDFRRWLYTPDSWVNHNIAREAHHHGTATWFTQSEIMNNWKTTGSLMWIHGLRSYITFVSLSIADSFYIY